MARDNGKAEQRDLEEKTEALLEALADYYEIEREGIFGYVIGVERINGEQLTFSSIWSGGSPPWRLDGFVRELGRHIEESQA